MDALNDAVLWLMAYLGSLGLVGGAICMVAFLAGGLWLTRRALN